MSVSAFGAVNPIVIEKEIKDKVADVLIADYPFLTTEDIHVKIVNKKLLYQLPPVADSYKLGLRKGLKLLGRTLVPLELKDQKGGRVSRELIQIHTDAYGPVVRATRRLTRRSVVTTADVIVVRTSLLGQPNTALRSLDDVVGMEAVAGVLKGATFTSWTVRTVPLIHRHDQVDLLMKSGPMEIRVKGQALDDGAKGATIRVRAFLEKRKIVEGRVIDERTVKVNYTP